MQSALSYLLIMPIQGVNMDELEKEEHKALVKEAIMEWLDEKYAQFGKWTFHGILAAALGAFAYYLAAHGGIKII